MLDLQQNFSEHFVTIWDAAKWGDLDKLKSTIG